MTTSPILVATPAGPDIRAVIDRTSLRLQTREASPLDFQHVVDWLRQTGEQHLIAGEVGPPTEENLRRWTDDSRAALALDDGDGSLQGFATLSTRELPCPPGTIEVCHLIVRPDARRRYVASHMLLKLSDWGRSAGYAELLGRVVPHNLAGQRMLRSMRWNDLAPGERGLPPEFCWFARDLRRE